MDSIRRSVLEHMFDKYYPLPLSPIRLLRLASPFHLACGLPHKIVPYSSSFQSKSLNLDPSLQSEIWKTETLLQAENPQRGSRKTTRVTAFVL